MNNLYKLYISICADLKKDDAMKVTLYEYKVSSVKNKYIEIEVNGSKKRISFEKLNLIQGNTQSVKHISYYVWLDNDDEEVINKNIKIIKERIDNNFKLYKETINKLESNLKYDHIYKREIVNERY